MNISIISTYKKETSSNHFTARKVSEVLLHLAESHLQSPELSHFISEDGVNKVRKKLAK